MIKILIEDIQYDEKTNRISNITCRSDEDAETIYEMIKNETDFMLTWNTENNKIASLIIIGNLLTPKLNNGELIITVVNK